MPKIITGYVWSRKGGRRAIFALGVSSLYGPAHPLKAELAMVGGNGTEGKVCRSKRSCT